MKFLIILLFLFSVISCVEEDGIPSELTFTFEYLDENLDGEKINAFKNKSEDKAILDNHRFGIGLFLRNNLLRHHEESDNLCNFFYSIEIYSYDDMSSIIMTSYHRSLLDEDIELDQQILENKEYYKPINECKNQLNNKALNIYNKYEVNDTINIKMPVSESNSVIDHLCPNIDWDYDETKDLSINAMILDKYSTNNKSKSNFYYFFQVRVLTKNHLETEILMRPVYVGDELRVALKSSWIFSSL
ncbi:MAG: hypothetical protein GQ574_16175 [Crocinitomix sp.]|nr:hypothetical protein [Crocinitomix sp.]